MNEETTPRMLCPECGDEIPVAAEFCPKCGKGTQTAETPEDALETPGGEAVAESTESEIEGRFWQKWDDLIDKLENDIPWNAVFLVLGTGFLLLTYFTNK